MKKNVVIILAFVFAFLAFAFGVLYIDANSRLKHLRKSFNEFQHNDAKVVETPVPNDGFTLEEKEKLENTVDTLKKEKLDLEEENSRLKKENKEVKEEKLELETSIKNSSSSNSSYLSIKFWQDGKNYKISDTELKLYKDSVLSKEVSDSVTVVSPTISEDRLENGQTVYSVMSNKGLVFMSSYPSLSVIEGSHLTAPASAFSQKATDKYLAIKFWEGPDYYKNLSKGIWYTDYSLQKTIDNSESIVIISENTDCFVMKNGIEVYTAMAEDGAILWMHDSPSLETIE